MMRIIKDIRVFRSNNENTGGNPLPNDAANKELDCVIRRIGMKLREERFSLGEFDHLYINFTWRSFYGFADLISLCFATREIAKKQRPVAVHSDARVLSLCQEV